MSARLSGVLWLLIEICARSLVTDASAGCSTGRDQHRDATKGEARGGSKGHAWVGIDVGKTHHWVCAVDADGKTLLSVKVANDEAGIIAALIASDRADKAADVGGRHHRRAVGAAARVAGPGRRAGALRVRRVVVGDERCICRRGQDRRQGRPSHRRDRCGCARTWRSSTQNTDQIRNLEVLTAHRADLIADRVRMINRLRDVMTSVFPTLERAFDYSSTRARSCCSPDTPARSDPPDR